jgi:prolyl-tRNA editing enzyme YbaK/EbsC (Cys-tRNA(Pro) deacylase)
VSQKTPSDLDTYIRAHDIAAELVFPSEETPTVALAARAMSCAEDQIVKSVLFLVKRDRQLRPVLVITSGTAQIDFRKLAEHFAVGRKRIRLAPAEVVLAETGYPAGGVPPFGFDRPIATFVDRAVFEQPAVFAGGGDDRTLLRTTPAELVRVTGAQIIDAREERS